jgi:hypothetical protein
MNGRDCHLVTTSCAATSKKIVEECGSIHVHLKYSVLLSTHSARIPSTSHEWRTANISLVSDGGSTYTVTMAPSSVLIS